MFIPNTVAYSMMALLLLPAAILFATNRRMCTVLALHACRNGQGRKRKEKSEKAERKTEKVYECTQDIYVFPPISESFEDMTGSAEPNICRHSSFIVIFKLL